MIKATDAFKLAQTKLRTRRIRLIITVITSSLLFTVLGFSAFFISGIINSLESFSKEGYGNRYIVQASPVMDPAFPGSPAGDELLKVLSPINKDIIAQKKALAKKLSIIYDENSDTTLPINTIKNPDGTTQAFANTVSPLVQKTQNDIALKTPGIKYDDFSKKAKDSGAIALYRGASNTNGMPTASSNIKVIVNGKEKIDSGNQSFDPYSEKGINTITSQGWVLRDDELLKPFLLNGATLNIDKDGAVPIFAPISAAEEILGLKALPDTATPKERLQRLEEIRTKIVNKTSDICYRNARSSELLTKADQQTKEIAANKNKKDYEAPHLQYAVPSACGLVTVSKDTRTAEEKKVDANQEQFDRTFMNDYEPKQGMIKVKIVGVSPDISSLYSGSFSVSTILSAMLQSSLGYGWFSPNSSAQSNVLIKTVMGGDIDSMPVYQQTYYAEFPNVELAKKFIDDQTCKSSFKNPNGSAVMVSGVPGMNQDCAKDGKVFNLSAYGSSAGAVADFKKNAGKFFSYATIGVVIIASLIMAGNIGKIIADSRRETAVFRALGAKRLDIAQIYYVYTLMICIFVAIFALILGLLAAYYIDSKYGPRLSVDAVLAYNANDIYKKFNLIGIRPDYLIKLVGVIILTGILSASLPLLSNMRRNPIKDMRDEN